ncbi:hypothetical protein VKT23_008929 [Stygiomarasmius scandens]|uniref:Peptidase M20 domain-containing protein 2 n=1 Tax=Marasmiellus scandens TaxID=2682957 RepID=A0ABR1JGT9_9AGAR
MTSTPSSQVWRPGDKIKPTPVTSNIPIFRQDILEVAERKIEDMSEELRKLSLDIHDHPELAFEEKYAHDVLSEFMSKQGFVVQKQYLLSTAWIATFRHGDESEGGRVVGVNSEMDALPGIGHACGHNLIAISGVAVACAIKTVLEQFDLSGEVQLLGTPAEESGEGKIILLNKGAYKDMDVCLMCHPAPGPKGSVSLSRSLAVKEFDAEYFGHTAHAGEAPFEGINALDGAVLSYSNVNALRQQLKPNIRVHGILHGKDWAPNIIPDYARYAIAVRAPTLAEQEAATERVLPCLQAGALASGCEHKITKREHLYDLRQNKALGEELANVVQSRYGSVDYVWGIANASTDFGNISYEIPSLHPGFAIPTTTGGGNHTPEFTKAAATQEAHQACLDISKALAATGIRVLIDDEFYAKVKQTFEEDKVSGGGH